MRLSSRITIEHDSMSGATRAVECNPLRSGTRPDEYRAVSRQSTRHLVGRFDGQHDAPTSKREPVEPRYTG
jgi:hypothetical protein